MVKMILRGDKKGFTLLEILVAAGILLIGAIALANLIIYVSTMAAVARNRTIASNLAQSKLEEFMALPYYTSPEPSSSIPYPQSYIHPDLVDSVANWTDADSNGIPDTDTNGDGIPDFYDYSATADHSDSNNPINAKGETAGADDVTFTRIWNIADNVPESNLKTIAVIVSWQTSVKTYSCVLSTIKAKREKPVVQ